MRCRSVVLLAVVLCTGLSASAQAPRGSQPRFRESIALQTSAVVVKKLATVGEYLADGQIDEAVEILRDVSAASGDTLVPVGPGRYVNASRYGHLLVAGLSPDGLAAYRQRVDVQARQWFEQGRARRDETRLRRVVEQAFASSAGDDALWLLGEWAWDRGELSAARAYWTQMLPLPVEERVSPGQPVPLLRYPDSDRSPAEILARLVLVSILEGDFDRAADELAVFRARHASAAGDLAGRHGLFVETLEAVLAEARGWTLPAGEAQFQTFAVNPQRDGSLPQPPPDVGNVLWADTLEPERWTTGNPRPALPPDPPLRLFPVVHEDMVLASDGQQIFHWKLRANEPTPVWPAGERGVVLFPELAGAARTGYVSSRVIGVPRHTLTVHHGRLYAKLGSPIAGRSTDEVHQYPSTLVCLDLSPDKQGKRVWELSADELLPGEPDWMFEGSPVVRGTRVFVALRKNHPDARVRVACLDAGTGRPVWNRFVGSSVYEVGDRHHLMSHQLLTLGENAVFYSTDMGAIVALDVRDGRPLWVVTYESHKPADVEPLNDHLRNGLTPCLYHRGLVIAAPNDYGGVMAIDAETGRLRWEPRNFPDRIRHLLGVGRGKVFVSGKSLWALDLRTGSEQPPGGWGEPAEQNPQVWGYGQGVLVGDVVLFPKRDTIEVRDQATGQRERVIRLKEHDPAATGGNLAVAGRHLIVAEPNRIVVFSDTSGLLEERRHVVETNPRSIRARFELAQTLELAGDFDEALEQVRVAATLTPAGRGDEALMAQARRQTFDLLVRLGRRAAEAGDLPQAVSRLTTAIEQAPDDVSRLWATWRLAEAQAARGRPEHAVRTYQSMSLDAALARLPAPSDPDQTVGGAARAAVDRLIQEHGRGVYAAVDEQASQQFSAAADRGDPRELRSLLEAFPQARAAGAARLELARLHRGRQEPRDALRIAGQLLAGDVEADVRRGALELLARVHEDREHWRAAAQAWEQLAEEFPQAVIESEEQAVATGSVVRAAAAEYVARRLSSPPYAGELPPDGRTAPPLPWERLWHRDLPSRSDVVIPEGTAPASRLRCVLFSDPELHAIDRHNGRDRWSLRLDHPVLWAAYLGGELVVGTRQGLRGLTIEDGQVLWERPLRPDGSLAGGDPSGAAAPRFALAGEHVVCLVPGSHVLSLDAEGRVRWSFDAAGGGVGPRWFCDREHTVVQTLAPGSTVILDSSDGRVLAESPPDEAAPWLRDPVRLAAGRFAVVEASRRIRVLTADPRDRGWAYTGAASHANADPDIRAARERLLVVIDGDTLISLDPQTGQRQWARHLSRAPLSAACSLLATDEDSLYSASDGILRRISLADGGLAWEQFLGSRARPREALRFDEYVAVAPVGTPLNSSSDDSPSDESLMICHALTGAPAQELLFPAEMPSSATGLRLHVDWPVCVVIRGNAVTGLGRR